jgi:hypothetical protein
MLIIKGHKFAETDTEFTDSLFTDKTCSGYAKRLKRNIYLMNMQKQKTGFINTHGVIGSCREMENGKVWHSYANHEIIGELSFQEYDEILSAVSIGKDKKGYMFK